jgi:hypothetical protein
MWFWWDLLRLLHAALLRIDHLQVVVQKRIGELLWEGGDNRKVVVPEDAPAGKC